jgi:hypothetical protein
MNWLFWDKRSNNQSLIRLFLYNGKFDTFIYDSSFNIKWTIIKYFVTSIKKIARVKPYRLLG